MSEIVIDMQHGFAPLPDAETATATADIDKMIATAKQLEEKGLLKPIRLFSDMPSLEQLNHVVAPNPLWPTHTRMGENNSHGDQT